MLQYVHMMKLGRTAHELCHDLFYLFIFCLNSCSADAHIHRNIIPNVFLSFSRSKNITRLLRQTLVSIDCSFCHLIIQSLNFAKYKKMTLWFAKSSISFKKVQFWFDKYAKVTGKHWKSVLKCPVICQKVHLPINFISGRKSLVEFFHKGQVTPGVVKWSTVRYEPVILFGDMLLSGRWLLALWAGRPNCYMVPYKQEADDLNKPPVHALS